MWTFFILIVYFFVRPYDRIKILKGEYAWGLSAREGEDLRDPFCLL